VVLRQSQTTGMRVINSGFYPFARELDRKNARQETHRSKTRSPDIIRIEGDHFKEEARSAPEEACNAGSRGISARARS
jgi:hypothetical protein